MNALLCEPACTTVKENKLTNETDSEAKSTVLMKMNKTIFVTVGTTSFDQLVLAFNDFHFQNILLDLGYNCVIFQIGKGLVKPISCCNDLAFEYFTFKANLRDDLERCDLVVSHAGAGTCLEVCRASKRLVVVVNDMLMNNHQSELASKLAELGHCLYSTCQQLSSVFASNRSIVRAGIDFHEVFSQFDTDYYYVNVAKAVEEMFQ